MVTPFTVREAEIAIYHADSSGEELLLLPNDTGSLTAPVCVGHCNAEIKITISPQLTAHGNSSFRPVRTLAQTGFTHDIEITDPAAIKTGTSIGPTTPDLSKGGTYIVLARFYDRDRGAWMRVQLFYATHVDTGINGSDIANQTVKFSGWIHTDGGKDSPPNLTPEPIGIVCLVKDGSRIPWYSYDFATSTFTAIHNNAKAQNLFISPTALTLNNSEVMTVNPGGVAYTGTLYERRGGSGLPKPQRQAAVLIAEFYRCGRRLASIDSSGNFAIPKKDPTPPGNLKNMIYGSLELAPDTAYSATLV